MAPSTRPDRWRRVESLFHAACEKASADRPAFLEEACGDDAELRREVESLLESADHSLGFLKKPVEEAARRMVEPAQVGERIGPYKILWPLGEGGMGRVYLAARADDLYQRQVAIKFMRVGFGSSQAMLERFRAERQILANLDHPHIARLLDGGVAENGAPYLVMEYVDGVPIDEFCRRHRLALRPRLLLFDAVCRAVEYAHNNLVVHRDIKPANILVTADGTPKLLDFGIAKLLDPELGDSEEGRTSTTERLMTPEYASPEQIRGEAITTVTDVYGLGVLLYELLAGQRPFKLGTKNPLEVARIICERQPEAPGAVFRASGDATLPDGRKIQGDLDNIVLMAMRKEPARRYPSAAQFSADLHAYLQGFPLRAQTDSWGYRAGKFVGRNKAAVAAGAFMLVALLGFGVEMGLMARRATRQQEIAQKESQFLAGLFQAAGPEVARGRTITARELLDQGARRAGSELAKEPEVQASLLFSMAGAYRSLGLFDEGAALAERAYDLKTQTLGAGNPGVAPALNLWAALLSDKGQFQKAEGLFRQLLSIERKTYGEGSAQLADALSALGECLYNEDKDAEAEPILRQALSGGGNGAQSASETRNYLALVLERKGSYPEATELLREAEEISRRQFGADSPDYAISLHNLGSVLIDAGDLDGAEVKLREALAIRRRVLGDNHPTLEYSLNNLAYVLREKGDWKAAEPFARENRALVFRTLGAGHPTSAKADNALARVLQSEGDFAEADEDYRQALEILRKADEPDGWAYAQILTNLSTLNLDRRDYLDAESEAREALERFRKLGGENTPLVAVALIECAQDRLFQHDPGPAEPLLREALEIRKRKYPAGHPEVIAAEVRLGEALIAEGKSAEAEVLLRRAGAEVKASPHPLPAWRVADAESALAAALWSEGKQQEAAALDRQSEAGLRTNPRPAFRVPARVRLGMAK